MSNGDSLISLEGISEAAKTLIEKISDAIGGELRPRQIRRVAQAEADAALIAAKSQIEITELQTRALKRFLVEEAQKQDNIEQITQNAAPLLNSNSKPQDMQNDWITNFFDKCRIISDSEMQLIWGRILAGEANAPGTFSKRTINVLGSIDKSDAMLFTKICNFSWLIGNMLIPLIFNSTDDIYKSNGINFEILTHLDDIGLIRFDHLSGFTIGSFKTVILVYHDNPLILEADASQKKLLIGKVLFTRIGSEIAKICVTNPINGIYDYIYEQYSKMPSIKTTKLKNS